jgi:Putative zinc-finger
MACEKYSGWMMDAALGGLRGEEEAELRAHIAGCAGCHAEWDAARALAAAVDGSVESLVAGEPSPQFAARLRTRLAEAPAPAAWPLLLWPRFAAAALVMAVMLIAVLMTRAPNRPGVMAPVAVNSSPATERSRVQETASTPERVAAVPPVAARRGGARHEGRYRSLPFEVLIQKGQLSAALLLSEGVSAGTIDGVQLVRLAEHSAQPLEVKTLEIQPLAVPSATEGESPAAGGDGGRF